MYPLGAKDLRVAVPMAQVANRGATMIRMIRHLSDRLSSRDLAKAYVAVR